MDFQLVALLALLVLSLLVLLTRKSSSSHKRLPPGPPRLPLIGNLHQLSDPLHRTLHKFSLKYGDIMLLKFGTVNTLVLASEDVTRQVIKNHDITFGARAVGRATRKLSYDVTDITFAPYGDYWREVRKIGVLELLSPKRVQSFRPAREEEVKILRDNILVNSSSVFDLSELLHGLANNLLCRVAFGRKFVSHRGGSKTPYELLQETQTLVGTICLSDFFPFMGWLNKVNGFDARVEENFKGLDDVFETVIQEHLDPNRPKPEAEDLVDVLLKIQKDKTRPVSHVPTFIKAIISDMFIGGTDTTAATLIWVMTELLRHPSSMKTAQEEVRNFAKGKAMVEENDLPQLPYLKAVIKEAFRLHPPVPLMIPRETVEEVEIKGYTIPAKTTVFINAYSMSMDPKSWENPSEFRPERFLNSQIDYRGQHYELLPFGVGRRACPGLNFAAVTIENVIANLLLWFDWQLPKGVTKDDVDVSEAVGIVVIKQIPLQVVAKPVNI